MFLERTLRLGRNVCKAQIKHSEKTINLKKLIFKNLKNDFWPAITKNNKKVTGLDVFIRYDNDAKILYDNIDVIKRIYLEKSLELR